MAINKVYVVGSGLMGGGITQVCATAGYKVICMDFNDAQIEKAKKNIAFSLGKFAEKGRITEEVKEQALANITYTTNSYEGIEDADLVIEAVFEDIDVKQQVFAELDKRCKPGAILATNTSAISITAIASATARPESVVGTHFFSPVPMMKLCEIIRGLQTTDETMAAVTDFAIKIGKEVVSVEQDVAGFIANRIGMAMSNTAIRVVELGVATPQDIDKAMTLGFSHRMGPFETADLTGLDILLNAMIAIYDATQDERYAPPELLIRMVRGGLLGRKTGKGWYDHSSGKQVPYWTL